MLYKLGLPALAAEAGAVSLLFLQDRSVVIIMAFLCLHGLGSLLTALVVRLVLPARFREPSHWVVAYLVAFNFLMPLTGLFCVMAAIASAVLFPARRSRMRFRVASAPQFTTHRNHEGTGFRGGQVRAQLNNGRAPLDQRMKALVAVQETPARATADLLRDLLSDSAEDLRLLAYGILDGKEKSITERILENKSRLESTARVEERSHLHEAIAGLYWELIYQNLVQGDMRTFSAEQVRLHVNAALSAGQSGGPSLWFLLARLELSESRIEAARHALLQAERQGFVRERLLPYLAELCFLEKQFDEVRRLLADLEGKSGLPALAPVIRFWSAGSQTCDRSGEMPAATASDGLPGNEPNRRIA